MRLVPLSLALVALVACDFDPSAVDLDQDGFLPGEDCNDLDPAVNPDAIERCNAIDDDCNGETDEATAVDAVDWYPDTDRDGYGAEVAATTACVAPSAHTDQAGDCDDTLSIVNPGAIELCDALDRNCDGDATAGANDPREFFEDLDGDGFGTAAESTLACTLPSGHAKDDGDCDDTAVATYPGAPDLPGDGVDQDCNGSDAPLDLGDDTVPFSGDVILQTPLDATQFCAERSTVNGDLWLDGFTASDLSTLECLESVLGDLHFVGTDVLDATMPNLTSVGGTLRLENEDSYRTADFPSLDSVGADLIIPYKLQTSFPTLVEVMGAVRTHPSQVGSLQSLEHAGRIRLSESTNGSITLTSLQTLGGPTELEASSVVLPALTAADELTIIAAVVDVSALATVDHLSITHALGPIDLSSLATATTVVADTEASIELPAALTVERLDLIAEGQPTNALPALTGITHLKLYWVGATDPLVADDITSLVELDVHTNASESSFASLTEARSIHLRNGTRTTNLSALQTVGALVGEYTFVDLDLRSLSTVRQVLSLGASADGTVNLSSLEEVAGDALFYWSNDTATLQAPKLARVLGALDLGSSAKHTTDLPALTSVGFLHISRTNPTHDQTYAALGLPEYGRNTVVLRHPDDATDLCASGDVALARLELADSQSWPIFRWSTYNGPLDLSCVVAAKHLYFPEMGAGTVVDLSRLERVEESLSVQPLLYPSNGMASGYDLSTLGAAHQITVTSPRLSTSVQLPSFAVELPALTSASHLMIDADGVPIMLDAPVLPSLLTATLDGASPILLDLPTFSSLESLQVTNTSVSSALVAELEAFLAP